MTIPMKTAPSATGFIAAAPGATALHVDDIEVRYGSYSAIRNISLQVAQGETTAVIGPSGCGKSTTLKAVAGLNHVARGRITLNDRDITDMSPAKRNIGLVPQSYAVFPHMSVFNNIAYGLKARKQDAPTIRKTVDRILELTQLRDFAERKPDQLSGGQRQRVALGRALAIEPDVLLLDEPLAALDPQLRGELRRQLAAMLRDAGCGTLIVTHDQHEALALAQNIAILRDGELIQYGTPEDLWLRPKNAFVADFLTNSVLLDSRVEAGAVHLFNGTWSIPLDMFDKVEDDRSAQVLLRPTSLQVATADEPAAVEARVDSVEYAGGRLLAVIEIAGQKLPLTTEKMVTAGDRIVVAPISRRLSLIGS